MTEAPAADIVETMTAYEQASRRRPWISLYPDTNAAPVDGGSQTVLDLFRAAPREAPAITYFDATLDYAEVDRLSDALAGWLAVRGAKAGDRVAVILQNTPHFVIAAVATWKLSAVVVTLNPMYRQPELERLFTDCAPHAIICHDNDWSTVAAAANVLAEPPHILWASGREFQCRNDSRVLPSLVEVPKGEPLSRALAAEHTAPRQGKPCADEIA